MQGMTSEKLHKVLAGAGLGSRRQIEKWIADGRVRVDGDIAPVGLRIDRNAHILVDNKPVCLYDEESTRVLMYHKPLDEISTRSDPQGRPTVFDRLPKVATRWVAVGRLDINTTGLLLFTNDGGLAAALMHPASGMEREYMVRVHGSPTREQLSELRSGVLLAGHGARFNTLELLERGSGSNRWYRVTVSEGRNREVRRLWQHIGCRVNQLRRVRYGPLVLPAELSPGRWRELQAAEIQAIRERVGEATAAR